MSAVPITNDATAPQPALVAHDVRKSYPVGKGTVEILHGITMGVSLGEMVAVMGPSGSGKSTLLYCLAGLEDATSGEVTILGRPQSSLSRADRAKLRRSEVGFVFQAYNLIPTLTAYENVALPYLLRRDPIPDDLIRGTLAAVGLGERIEARPTSMSGGEQQRVALARVLAQQPRLVFADEPTGALDTRSGQVVLDELTKIAHQPDRCVVVVTHDPSVAARCDRVVFMRDGLLVDELTRPTIEQVAAALTALTATKAGS